MTADKRKITAILGGSFNPLHNGHVAMLDAARRMLSPDELWLMPAKKPPHKPSYDYASDEDRLSMLTAYAETKDDVFVQDAELMMEGFTYTCNTLLYLNEHYPDRKFYFIIGGDSLKNFHNWYHPEIILDNAALVVCVRADVEPSKAKGLVEELRKAYGGEYHILDFKPVDISSSMIREKLTANEDVKDLLPDSVYDLIRQRGLYQNGEKTSDMDHEALILRLKAAMKVTLKPSRYEHSLGVMETACRLSGIYGANKEKAAIAGILHDCAKYMPPDELVNLCLQNGIKPSASELESDITRSSLLHSKAGMILAKNIYSIEDEDILNAIFYHTVGRPAMSLLEKIIFVADFIEPSRTQDCDPPLESLRRTAKENIDLAVYLISENTINYLKSCGRTIDEGTIKTRDYYKALVAEE